MDKPQEEVGVATRRNLQKPPAARLSPAILGLLFAVGLGARLAVVAFGFSPMAPDSTGYWEPAKSITEGRGYLQGDQPTADRTPTYPLFLALIILVAGADPHRALLVQIALTSTLGMGLAWWLGRRGLSRGAAVAAGLLVGLDPFLVAASSIILAETLGAVLLTALVMALRWATTYPTWRRWAVVGLLAGALGLNTPNTLALLPFLFLWLALGRRPSARIVLRWGLALLLMLACLGVWSVRNQLAFRKMIPVRSYGFTSLIWGTTEYPFHWVPDPESPDWQPFLRRFKEIGSGRDLPALHEVEGEFLRAAWNNVREQPVQVLWRVAKANFWFWVEIPGAVRLLQPRPILRWTLLVFHQLQLLAFLVGLFVLRWRAPSESASLALGCVVYFALSLMLMFPIPRYYVPVLPMVDMIAAVGLADWWRRHRAAA